LPLPLFYTFQANLSIQSAQFQESIFLFQPTYAACRDVTPTDGKTITVRRLVKDVQGAKGRAEK
jgi:hypothetical protein